jgi:hypothetical protein
VAHLVRRRTGSVTSAGIGLLLLILRHHFRPTDEDARINTQCPADKPKYNDRADPDAGATPRDAATILDAIAGW